MPIDNTEVQTMLDAERAALAPDKVAALEATEAMKAMIAVPANTDSVVRRSEDQTSPVPDQAAPADDENVAERG